MPALLHHDETLALTVMELLEPHIIMRKGHGRRDAYIRASSMRSRLSWRARCSSPPTSPCRPPRRRQGIAAFAGNHALCKITEDLIFTDPYRIAEQNRWTAPISTAWPRDLRDDMELHVAISRLKLKFMASPEALLHGDLHTGSIMVTETETRVIDPEFAFYGPMGFDVGAVLANLLMAYFASAGHERAPGERRDSRAGCWRRSTRSGTSSRANSSSSGGRRRRRRLSGSLFAGEKGAAWLEAERQLHAATVHRHRRLRRRETLRRIFGLAHNIDFELIEDPAEARYQRSPRRAAARGR